MYDFHPSISPAFGAPEHLMHSSESHYDFIPRSFPSKTLMFIWFAAAAQKAEIEKKVLREAVLQCNLGVPRHECLTVAVQNSAANQTF